MRYFVIIALSALMLVGIWFRHGNLLGSAESALPFYDLSIYTDQTNWAWSYPSMGYPSGLTTASGPSYYFLSVLQRLGIPGVVLEAMVFWIFIFVSGISIYLLVNELYPEVQKPLALLGVYMYWFNPFSLVNVWNRFLYSHMAFFTLLPLVTFLFIRGLTKRSFRYVFLIGIAAYIFSYALTSLPFNLVLWMLLTYIVSFYIWTEKNKKIKLFYAMFYLGTLIFYILVNAWWITQLFSFVSSDTYFESSVSQFHSFIDSQYELASISERLGLLFNTMRFMHGSFFNEQIPWITIYQLPIVNIIQFLPIFLIFKALYSNYKNRNVLLIAGLTLLTLFLMKGDNPPLGEIFGFMYSKFIFMRVFRNPFEKIGFLLPLSIPLVIFSLSDLLNRFTNKVRINIIFFIFFLFIGYWGFPMWSGLVFTRTDSQTNNQSSYDISVPKEYKAMNDYLNNQIGEFRFISLPIRSEGITYTWDKPFAGVDLSSTLFNRANISHNTTIPFYSDVIEKLYTRHLEDNLLSFFPYLNAQYILLRSDIEYRERHMTNPEIVRKKLEEWESKGLIKKVIEEGKLALYKVDDKYTWPKLYIAANLIKSNQPDMSRISTYTDNFPQRSLAVVNPSDKGVTSNWLLKPDGIYYPKLISDYQSMSEADILARLLYVKHLPGSFIYPFVLWKERIEFPSASGYFTLGTYQSALVGKRAVEAYRLRISNADFITTKDAEDRYTQEIKKFSMLVKGLYKDLSGIPDQIKESLIIQLMLFQRSQSPLVAVLNSELKDLKIIPEYDLPQDNLNQQKMVAKFNIREEGEYDLNIRNLEARSDLFIDGQLSNFEKQEEKLHIKDLKLAEGNHEVALQYNPEELHKPIYKSDDKIHASTQSQPYSINLESLDSNYTYYISFDYKTSNVKLGRVLFVEDINYPANPAFAQFIYENTGWSHMETRFNTTVGATMGSLYLVPIQAAPDGQLYIRNITISRYQYPQMDLTRISKPLDKDTDTQISWLKVSPTSYLVKVLKKTPGPEMLVFSELFNSGWLLQTGDYSDLWSRTQLVRDWGVMGKEYRLKSGSSILLPKVLNTSNTVDHMLVNNMTNGWFIDNPGEYSYSIEFYPQRLLDLGRMTSLLTMLFGLISLGYLWKKSLN